MQSGRRAVLGLLAGAMPAGRSLAQAWPARPVRVIVNFPAGSGVDILTRLVTAKLAAGLGQPFVIENRGGAAGNIGAAAVARAAPDGYTLLATPSAIATNQTLYRNLPYSMEELTPVALTGFLPFMLVVNPALGAATLQQLVALGREKPGGLTFASTGNGSTPHVLGEEFRARTGIELQHIPYQASGPALNDLVAGRTDMMFANPLSVLAQVQSGRLVALAIATPARSPALPALPTMGESGLPGFETGSWYALFAPRGTPEAIIQRLNAAVAEALEAPDVRQQLAAQAAEPRSGSPEQVAAFVRAEVAKLGRIVEASGLRAD
ncbi:tripartite tricarboxylate transporter substrate binding protein [Roseomonas hellenica]|uniref:Tripartite tricarboxylate transporter substrate binding protein n=1 Tax=Plastoroseomonas hellenica TaxID=2687306 RepID=A0ABS5F5L5_9PROT|nr:tripartite tricarboxylate transporter substrate binding protein [Plastoroseomonas hellenica]MBR0667748.1 tripartite tricarboxylate transporter substrate binding protein [Plastoroseomonas hellenica]